MEQFLQLFTALVQAVARALKVAQFLGLIGQVVDELGGTDGDYGVVCAVDEEKRSGGDFRNTLRTCALAGQAHYGYYLVVVGGGGYDDGPSEGVPYQGQPLEPDAQQQGCPGKGVEYAFVEVVGQSGSRACREAIPSPARRSARRT